MRQRRVSWIPVVAAIIRRGEQVLLGQRPQGHSLAGEWEFPGGKIELGEQPHQSLARELREELDIEADIGPLRLSATHTYGDKGILILFFEVRFYRGEIKANHHAALKWVYPNEISSMEIPEANRRVLKEILRLFE